MHPNLVAAGLDTTNFDSFLGNINEKSEADIEIYLSKIDSLHASDGAYRGFMSVYGLKTPTWWNNMSMLGETDLREHKLLNAEIKKLRRDWKKFNGKPKAKTKQKVTDGVTEGV